MCAKLVDHYGKHDSTHTGARSQDPECRAASVLEPEQLLEVSELSAMVGIANGMERRNRIWPTWADKRLGTKEEIRSLRI